MRTFLCLLIVAALGGAAYEGYLHSQETANYVQQRAYLTAQIAKLTTENKALADGNNALTLKLDSLTPGASTNAAPAPGTPGP